MRKDENRTLNKVNHSGKLVSLIDVGTLGFYPFEHVPCRGTCHARIRRPLKRSMARGSNALLERRTVLLEHR